MNSSYDVPSRKWKLLVSTDVLDKGLPIAAATICCVRKAEAVHNMEADEDLLGD